MCALKIKEARNCHLGAGPGSAQPCLRSWPSATSTALGKWEETPQETAAGLLSKADLKPESNVWATEVTGLAKKAASYALC